MQTALKGYKIIVFCIVFVVGLAVGLIGPLTEVRAQAGASAQQSSCQFVNGLWFDGKDFKRRTIYSAHGSLTHKKPAKVDEVIDLEGGYVIPPFAEAHSHKLDLKSELAEQESRFIKEGTMYVMVLTNGASNAASNRLRYNRPDTLDVLYANGGITETGQHPSFAYERIYSGIAEWWMPDNMKTIQASRKQENNSYWFFDSVDDVNKKWSSYLASKPDLVKIYLLDVKNNAPTQKSISEEVAAEVVKKAHAAGLRVAAHIETFDDLRIGIKIGVDIFAHMPHYNYFFAKSEPAQPVFTHQELKAILKRRIVLIPTLSLNEEHAIVRDASNNYQGRFDEVRFNQVVEFQKKTIRTLQNAGFVFATGSDRDSVIPELIYWVKNKIFDSSFTLNAATAVTPQVMYPGRKVGSLKEGYEASFLVLGGNPLQDFEQIKNIRMRVKQGHILDHLGTQ
jgi:imidazolonepropionase-like amidohydrolase